MLDEWRESMLVSIDKNKDEQIIVVLKTYKIKPLGSDGISIKQDINRNEGRVELHGLRYV